LFSQLQGQRIYQVSESTIVNLNDRCELFKLNGALLRKRPPVHPFTGSHQNLQFDAKKEAELLASTMVEQFNTPHTISHVENVVKELINRHLMANHPNLKFFFPEEV